MSKGFLRAIQDVDLVCAWASNLISHISAAQYQQQRRIPVLPRYVLTARL
jgi:hypothetical protein